MRWWVWCRVHGGICHLCRISLFESTERTPMFVLGFQGYDLGRWGWEWVPASVWWVGSRKYQPVLEVLATRVDGYHGNLLKLLQLLVPQSLPEPISFPPSCSGTTQYCLDEYADIKSSWNKYWLKSEQCELQSTWCGKFFEYLRPFLCSPCRIFTLMPSLYTKFFHQIRLPQNAPTAVYSPPFYRKGQLLQSYISGFATLISTPLLKALPGFNQSRFPQSLSKPY